MGFIDFVVKPLYEVVSNYLPAIKIYLQQLDSNKAKWTEQISFYEAELGKIIMLGICLCIVFIGSIALERIINCFVIDEVKAKYHIND